MFEVKKFNSGEWDVKLVERIYGNEAVIHWNWFDEIQRDIMLLLMKIGAIKKQYGMIPIVINAPYLPYSRQDRVFEAGQDIPIETLIKAITGRYPDVTIKTMGLHCNNYFNDKIVNKNIFCKNNSILVYPDTNAIKHYLSYIYQNHTMHVYSQQTIILQKTRTDKGIKTEFHKIEGINMYPCPEMSRFLICDDICDGGRTFVETAKLLKSQWGNDITIELMIYHAFMTHGLDDLKAAGISKIKIINPDSYEYVINKFPEDKDYFESITI